MNAADEAWQRYWQASYVQMYAVAALDEIPGIDDLEQQMRACD